VAEEHFQVGVVVAKYQLDARWADYAWRPVTILPAVPATAPWTRLFCDTRKELIYAGSFEVCLHPGSTGHYRDNLRSGRPSLWIGLQCITCDHCTIVAATADPYEGEALTEWTSITVEAVPMPLEIQGRVVHYFGRFHKEHSFIKRRRDDSGPQPRALDVKAANTKRNAIDDSR
jgi:hypothetical protein